MFRRALSARPGGRGAAARILAAGVALVSGTPDAEAESVLVLGDSLSKEYAIQFALDGYGSGTRNWIEVLDDLRPEAFDMGSEGFHLDDIRVFGHEYNWSIPGGKIADFVKIVRGDGVRESISRNRIRDQLRNDVERCVFFIGGNDVDSVYGDAWRGEDMTAFIDGFVDGVDEVLAWIVAQASGRQIVLVAVPHVGITPKVKGEYPPDPVKTGNVSAMMDALNGRLAATAAKWGAGFADVDALTRPFLDGETFCYQGDAWINDGSASGALDHLWLAGDLSDNFHPNTNGQAMVANAIIGAFNAMFGSAVPVLSTEEILGELLGGEPDMPLAEWAACFGLSGADAAPEADPDGDRLSNLEEFGLGTDPVAPDPSPWRLRGPLVRDGTPGFEFRFPRRLHEGSAQVAVTPERSMALAGWSVIPSSEVEAEADGTFSAWIPLAEGRAFARLRVTSPR